MMRLALLAGLAVAWARPAPAQTCAATATGLSFGAYAPLSGTPTTITGTVTVTCQAVAAGSVSYVVALGPGGGIDGRSLSNGSARLRYQLYTDAAHTVVWGDGSGGTGTVRDGYSLPALGTVQRRYTIYGSVPARQLVAPGAYADVVTAIVSY